ncbi:MAG: ATP-binding cassette domain-containing protein [Chloroflexi bacterium]|nr:ATP-binding cassette domain-containing protein [Chloroflexota bacterium]
MEVAVHNLCKAFGAVRANDDLTLRFAAGQIHGVLGENGAGKSTLMKLIAGFLRPDGGSIRFDGREASLHGPGAALRAGVGMVHQDPLDLPAFTALENLLCAAPRGAIGSRAAGRQLLSELARRLGFTVEPDAPLASLTVGQRQQLEIIRLLACGARVLILDEPTTGITAAQTRALFAALRRLAAEGNTVLFVSHKLEEVAELCDTVCVLRAGRLVGEQLPMPVPQRRLLELMFGAAVAQPTAGGAGEVRITALRSEGGLPANAGEDGTPALPGLHGSPTTERIAGEAVWQLAGVSARAGSVALRDVSLSIAAGRIVGLAGLDGSGQPILLRLLTGRMRPETGHILVNGRALSGGGSRAYRAAGIEYLPADRLNEGMIGALSLTEHFALLQNAALVDQRAAERAARAAIADYAIKATPVTPIRALSGGNQQRALLALVPPDCRGIACEQPTRGLDVASAQAIWRRLLERRLAGCAIVFASADLDELIAYSDEVLVFFAGRVSAPLHRAELSVARLAELIGGVGFGGG